MTRGLLAASITGSVVFAMPHPAGKAALIGVATAVSVYLVRRGQGSRGKTVRAGGGV